MRKAAGPSASTASWPGGCSMCRGSGCSSPRLVCPARMWPAPDGSSGGAAGRSSGCTERAANGSEVAAGGDGVGVAERVGSGALVVQVAELGPAKVCGCRGSIAGTEAGPAGVADGRLVGEEVVEGELFGDHSCSLWQLQAHADGHHLQRAGFFAPASPVLDWQERCRSCKRVVER